MSPKRNNQKPKPVPEGVLMLSSENDALKASLTGVISCSILFFLSFTLIVSTPGSLSNLIPEDAFLTTFDKFLLFVRGLSFVFVFFSVCLLSTNILIATFTIFKLAIKALKFPATTLTLANHPLRMGEPVVLHYRSRIRFVRNRQSITISGQLRCNEEITVNAGSTTTKEEVEVHNANLPPVTFAPGTSHLHYEATVVVPLDAPPSIELTHNKVRWVLEVSLHNGNLVGSTYKLLTTNYPLEVIPEALP